MAHFRIQTTGRCTKRQAVRNVHTAASPVAMRSIKVKCFMVGV